VKTPGRVVICGGGVAAVEAMLALREILAIRPHIDLLAPNEKFIYAPMAVAEPFGLVETRRFDLAAIAEDLGAELHPGALARVDGEARQIVLEDGSTLAYDATLIAVGAVRKSWLEGALSFGGAPDIGVIAELLERLEQGEVTRLAFVSPPGLSWTLPLYELALLTAAHLAERGIAGVELTVLTAEAEPLKMFGPGAGRMLGDLLSDRGIRLRKGASAQVFAAERLELSSGESLEVDTVVALPRLEGPRVEGLPCDGDGFILIDDHCRVLGMQDVYAAGDGVAFPIKQGGIATQQADVAAEGIAAGLGAQMQPAAFEPLLKGLLLTGVAPLYMRAGAGAESSAGGEVATNALWWPPTKIAGRYLGPYLAFASSLERHIPLAERPPSERDPQLVEAAHRDARALALTFAEADAHSGDFRSALSWLEIIERLDGVLPAGYLEIRAAWRARLG
jgi:sulfide:quinone oxidoreductase